MINPHDGNNFGNDTKSALIFLAAMPIVFGSLFLYGFLVNNEPAHEWALLTDMAIVFFSVVICCIAASGKHS